MVSNRLPVDWVEEPDGTASWRPSPGGLVTAIQPIVEHFGCLWIGWAGTADEQPEPFALGSMRLAPVHLAAADVEGYYEGFSNGTLWPLYHDVISRPEFHREWWERYQEVNRRFAHRIAEEAAEGAVVWVHDYQLQLVPSMLRELRSDLMIAFFLHIPFPPLRLFAQLPWRKRIIEGLLGADVIGFQQVADARNFREAAAQLTRTPARGNTIVAPDATGGADRSVLAQEFSISIDVAAFAELASRPEVRRRAAEIRSELGDPRTVMLGVDRLDYTKGIRHRLKAFDELLSDGELAASDIVFVQVASPSRERVGAYRQLRDEVESTVGRINGAHGTIGRAPLVYLHRGHSREEMVALYLAADVLLVTPLRDGMNLVAKEYVACRGDERGVLVLSEFAGAAVELRDALLVNPHDIEGLKAAVVRAVHMPEKEQRRRMRGLRRAVQHNDVAHWASGYLGAVRAAAERRGAATRAAAGEVEVVPVTASLLPRSIEDRVRSLATLPELIVATDFDGTVAPLVARPQDARVLTRAARALNALDASEGTRVVLLTGRSLSSLDRTGMRTDSWIVSGSHGAELRGIHTETGRSEGAGTAVGPAVRPLDAQERDRVDRFERRLRRVFGREPGVRLESKPFGVAVHTRQVGDERQSEEVLAEAVALGTAAGLSVREGKRVREFSLRDSHKGAVLRRIREAFPEAPVLFLGDDVTDEDVFRELGPDDLGIKVGEGITAAAERVPNPETAAAVLGLLVELRTGEIIGSEQ